MGVVLSILNLKYKLDDQGMVIFSLGYAQQHLGGTYHMLYIGTKRIVLIHDVVFLNKHTVSTYQENKLTMQPVISSKIKTSTINGIM